MWLQKTKPSNASSKWKLSGQALSNVSSSTRTLELCSKRAVVSLYLQHKFCISNRHHQTAQKQKDKRTQHLLLYFMSYDFLGLWCPVFNPGGSQSWICLKADWLPMPAGFGSVEFMEPDRTALRAQPAGAASPSHWHLHPEPGSSSLRVRQRLPD